MWDSANEVSRILGVWRCAGMRLRWEAAVGGRRVAWREADCSREPPHAGGRFSMMPGQKGAAFPDFFAFGSLPPKPAHIEQNDFEAWCWEWLFPQNRSRPGLWCIKGHRRNCWPSLPGVCYPRPHPRSIAAELLFWPEDFAA